MFYNLRELDGLSFLKQTLSSTTNHELACLINHTYFQMKF